MKPRAWGTVLAIAIASCVPTTGPVSPGVPGTDFPAELPGEWASEEQGLSLTLGEDGAFTWKQGELVDKGRWRVSGGSLVLTVKGGYSTVYSLVELTQDELAIKDPAGTLVHLAKPGAAPEEKVGVEAGGAAGGGSDGQAPGFDAALFPGVWVNVGFTLRISLDEAGTFTWTQGTLVESGTWAVESGAIRMSTGGHTSSYAIVSVTEKEMLIVDPAGNQLPLSKEAAMPGPAEPTGKVSLLAGTPSIKIVGMESGAVAATTGPKLAALPAGVQKKPPAGAVSGPGGLFWLQPPAGWKVDTGKVCGNKFTPLGVQYSCWTRNDVFAPDSSRVHFDIGVYATWAAPGALEALTPKIDAMTAAYDEDRTSVPEDMATMQGFDVFATSVGGRASVGGKQMTGRILGVHYGDLLIVGVAALSGDPSVIAGHGAEISAMLDSLGFYIVKGDLAGDLVGSWTDPGGVGWTFAADGKLTRGSATGRWEVLGTTLITAEDGGGVEAIPVKEESGSIVVGDVVLSRVN